MTPSVLHGVQLAAADTTPDGIDRAPQEGGSLGERRPGAIALRIMHSVLLGIMLGVRSHAGQRTPWRVPGVTTEGGRSGRFLQL